MEQNWRSGRVCLSVAASSTLRLGSSQRSASAEGEEATNDNKPTSEAMSLALCLWVTHPLLPRCLGHPHQDWWIVLVEADG